MSEQQNIDLVKRAYEAFMRGDLQTLLGFVSEELDFRHPMPQSIWPWAGKRYGRAGFAEFLPGLGEVIEYDQLEPREFIASGDRVAVIVFEHGIVRPLELPSITCTCTFSSSQVARVVQLLIFEDTAPIIAAMEGYRRQ